MVSLAWWSQGSWLYIPKQAFQETGNGSCRALKSWTQNSWYHITHATVLYKQLRFKGREFCSTYFFNDFIYLFISGYAGSSLLHVGLSLLEASGGSSVIEVCGLLFWWLLLLWSMGSRPGFSGCGTQVSCLSACGILLGQESKPCPLHCKVDF